MKGYKCCWELEKRKILIGNDLQVNNSITCIALEIDRLLNEPNDQSKDIVRNRVNDSTKFLVTYNKMQKENDKLGKKLLNIEEPGLRYFRRHLRLKNGIDPLVMIVACKSFEDLQVGCLPRE